MNPFIGVELQDKPGAIQRLLLMLGQRNVEIEQMTVKKDRETSRLTVMIGITGTHERAQWIRRQMTRHQDVTRTFIVKNSYHTVLIASVAIPRPTHVPLVSAIPIDSHAGYYTVAGPRHAIEQWIEWNHARVLALFPSCLTLKLSDKMPQKFVYHTRGGWNNERKIILRRQGRSEVVNR